MADAGPGFGERVPVPSTVFQPIATGGVNQQPVTSYVYENIGVNIDITPRMHHDDDVSLAVKVEISSISGSGFGGQVESARDPRTGETRLVRAKRNRAVQALRRRDDHDSARISHRRNAVFARRACL